MTDVDTELIRAMRATPFYRPSLALADECVSLGIPFRKALNFACDVEESLGRYHRAFGLLAREPRMHLLAKGARRSAKRALGLLMRKTFRKAEYNRAVDQLINYVSSLAKLGPLGQWGVCLEYGLDDNLVRRVTGRGQNHHLSRGEFLAIDPYGADVELQPWIFCAPHFEDLNPRTYSSDDAKKGLLRLLVKHLRPDKRPRGAPVNAEVQQFFDEVAELLESYCAIKAEKTNVKAMKIFDAIAIIYKLEALRPSYRAKAKSELKRRAKFKARGELRVSRDAMG